MPSPYFENLCDDGKWRLVSSMQLACKAGLSHGISPTFHGLERCPRLTTDTLICFKGVAKTKPEQFCSKQNIFASNTPTTGTRLPLLPVFHCDNNYAVKHHNGWAYEVVKDLAMLLACYENVAYPASIILYSEVSKRKLFTELKLKTRFWKQGDKHQGFSN